MLFIALIALFSGFLTVLSPCVLPILPIILANGLEKNRKKTTFLIFGIVLSFIASSLSLSLIVQFLGVPAALLRNVAVFLLVIIGLLFLMPPIESYLQNFLEKGWFFKPLKLKNKDSLFGSFLIGISLGFVWVPCVGPILATVATLAALNSLSIFSLLVALSYALGIGLALYLVSKGSSYILARFKFFKTAQAKTKKIFGLVVILTAFFIFFNLDRVIQSWTLSNLPSAWTQLPSRFESKFSVLDIITNTKSYKKPGASLKEVINPNVKLAADFSKSKIKKESLIQGCFAGKDCIASIDNPKFETLSSAKSWLNNKDKVFVLDLNNVVKVYPQKILNWHEIVNDTVDSTPVIITFCPLCGSAIAFERKVGSVVTQFGVSGYLRNSDLVMYDRYQGNLWQQISGEAIVGPAAEKNLKLKPVLLKVVTWESFIKNNELKNNIKVLSINTGFNRNYNIYPYSTYEKDDEILFGVSNTNNLYPPKTVVYGLQINGRHKAYKEEIIKNKGVITDLFEGVAIKAIYNNDGTISFINSKNNSVLKTLRIFWFAWVAFYPDTLVY